MLDFNNMKFINYNYNNDANKYEENIFKIDATFNKIDISWFYSYDESIWDKMYNLDENIPLTDNIKKILFTDNLLHRNRYFNLKIPYYSNFIEIDFKNFIKKLPNNNYIYIKPLLYINK